MYCIYCGQIVKPTGFDKFMVPIGFICTNPDCVNPKKEWTLSEDKDNQNWAIRHIRALEARVQQLETALDILLKKLGV
jgi:hypothetical protein